MIWILITVLGICTLAIIATYTFAVGLDEASDPDHAKAENLTRLEKSMVQRDDISVKAVGRLGRDRISGVKQKTRTGNEPGDDAR